MDSKLVLSRLTGSHIFGPGVFWWSLSYGILVHILGSSDLEQGNLFGRLVSVLAAHLCMIGVLYLNNFLSLKGKPTRTNLAVVIAGYLIAGAVRGLTLQALLYEFGAADSGFSFYRLIGGIAVMTSGLAWTAFVFGLKSEWGAKRANLLATEAQLESLLAASEDRLDFEATDTLSTIESMLQTALIPELMVSPQNAVTKLQALINDTLRPLSAFLAGNQGKIAIEKLDPKAHRFRWRMLLTYLTLRDSSRPIAVGLMLSLIAVNGFIKYFPTFSPVVLFLVSFLGVATSIMIPKYLVSRWVDQLPVVVRVPTVLLALFASVFTAGITVLSFFNNPTVALGFSLNGGVAAALLGALFGINKAANFEMQSIEEQLKNHEYRLRWTIAALNGRHWLQKKQFARKLHGPIQSEVAAAAIRIERSLSSGEVTEAGEEILQNLRDRLAKILQDTVGTNEIGQVMAEIIETWQGLCEIELDMSDQVQRAVRLDPVCVETVLEITREACSNAIRHGSADQVKINLSLESSDLIKIEVRNNGTKGILATRRGLGSTYLDDCTYSHKLEIVDGETMLTATVPLQVKPTEFQVQ